MVAIVNIYLCQFNLTLPTKAMCLQTNIVSLKVTGTVKTVIGFIVKTAIAFTVHKILSCVI